MTKTNLINAENARYVGQIEEIAREQRLPYGILNKKLTDVGGTFFCINSPANYIVVVPFRDLADSIDADPNNNYEVAKIYGGVTQGYFNGYMKMYDVHKIVVTYDSLTTKVIPWMKELGIDFTSYNLLVDEYHLMLEDAGFRAKAITTLNQTLSNFKHYTLMSATPIKDRFASVVFPELPYSEIKWDRTVNVIPRRIKTPNVYKAAISMIDMFLEGNLSVSPYRSHTAIKVEELYIFINSVKAIKEIIDYFNLEDDEVKVVCADSKRNAVVLGDIKVGSITEPNKKINFFSKKGFQGCNLFTNNGLVVVLSDAQREHTLVDISTTFHQIVGRIRFNENSQNVFREIAWHFYSTKRKVKTKEEFEEYMVLANKITDSQIKNFNNEDIDVREGQIKYKVVNMDNIVCYYDEETKELVKSPLKEENFRFRFELANETYKNGNTIMSAYRDAKLDAGKQSWENHNNIVITRITVNAFKELLKTYVDLREVGLSNGFNISNIETIKDLDREYPMFREAYDQLGAAGIATCNYNEKSIQSRLYAKGELITNTVYQRFVNKVGYGVFISNKDAKEILLGIYNDLKVRDFKPTVTMLKKCTWFEVIETVNKDENRKSVRGIKINQIY